MALQKQFNFLIFQPKFWKLTAIPKSISAAAKADDESKISKAPLQEEVEDSIDKVEVLPS